MSDTQRPPMDPSQLAQLQAKLDEANAQVAQVQAELAAAGTGGGASGPGIPAAAPGTVTVNGQDVHLGAGTNVRSVLDMLKAAQAGGGAGQAPTVIVNGQVVQPGSGVNLASMLSPAQLAKVQHGLAQLQATHPEYAQQLQGMFAGASGGGAAGAYASTPYDYSAVGYGDTVAPPVQPASVAPLADPPRAVPFVYRLATFDLSILELFLLLMLAVAPIALWIMTPQAAPVGLLVASIGIVVLRVRRYLRRIPLLKWGKVATVHHADLTSAGTYYSGTTYQNMRLRQAHGWTATTQWYSGPGYVTKIAYDLDGTQGQFTLRGLEYEDGVVLANSKHPAKGAMCVSQFPYDLTPQPDGQWPGRLTAWLWGGIVTTLAVEGGLLYLTVLAITRSWF